MLPGTSDEWRARLKLLAYNPVKIEVVSFINDQVLPALQEVAVELRQQDPPVEGTQRDDDGRAWPRVGHGEEMDFFYSVRPQPYEPATFAL
ncbi:hypothetical protein J7J08_13210 [Stenotrophomonas sp. ISL-67]|uniref:hypothetical protein n=1 Tax=Stenotrophomonas sp. ISL-67 TaxID=2819171 RepID=UPI001BEA7BCC|nr:hypothetical protein [Stenotrophomonas sp. ISL-67]MBT2768597.1 hypothetical protein [Stenotrophomonas sp. ISL-67]